MTKYDEEIVCSEYSGLASLFEPLPEQLGVPVEEGQSTYTISSNCSYSSRQVQWFWSSSKGNYANDYHLYNINVSGGQTVTITLKCTLNDTVEASAYMRVIYIDDNGTQVSKNLYYGQSLTLDFSSSTQLAVQTIISGTGSYAYAAYGARQQYSIEAKYTMASPDLAPLTLDGWDGPIVVSTTTGTNRNSSTITTDDNVYVDFAFWNQGGAFTKTTYVEFFLDGESLGTVHIDGASNYSYWTLPDMNFGKLSAGSHTVKMVLDSTGSLSESNESNNTYTKTFTVTQSTVSPDLMFFPPDGWSGEIVLSTTTDTNTNASKYTTDDNIYLDFAFGNAGGSTSKTYYVAILVDGQEVKQLSVTGGSDSGDAYAPEDYNLGKLSAGQHTITVKLDSTGVISESNENNNTVSKTITVTSAAKPDLAEYTPSGWSGPIVTSTVTGTNTNATKITTADNVYVDLAFGNDYAAIGREFYVALVLDDEIVGAWTVSSLSADSYSTIKDFDIGKLSVGEHALFVMLDPTEEISEANENNNIFYKTFTVTQNSVSADSYESGAGDNSRFKATKLAVGQTQSHTIHSKTDEDWMVFEVAEDGFYSVVTSGGDTVLQLYSFENQAFCYNDDRGNGDTGSFDTVQLYAGTKYYARVTGKGGALISYDIAVTKGVTKDTFEKNNDGSMSGASLLAAGQTQSHTIDSASDVDWIKFMISEEGRYFFSIGTSERYDGQISIELYGSDGNKIDVSSLNSELYKLSGENPYIAANYGPGMYYVKVTSAHGTAAGLYWANLTPVSTFNETDADEYEDDSWPDTMGEIKVGETQTHSLNVWVGQSSGKTQLDVDLISFTPTETGTYAIRVSNSNAPTHMTVYATDDYGLLVPVAGDNRINPFVENYFQAGQTYVIQMENDYLRLNVERYDITVIKTASYASEKDNYEGDDTRSAAKTISIGETQAHSIHVVGDQDWMKFVPTSSGYYTFYTGARNGNAGDPDMVLGLYDANGKLLANDDNSFACWNAMVAYELKAGQAYYLQAQAARANTVVPYYTVTVAKGVIEDSFDIYMDERSVNDNTMDMAMRIDLNTPTAHTLHSTSDVDWMWFEVTEEGDYTIQTTGNGDTYIRLYDENGNLLATDDDGGVGKNASITSHLTVDPAYGSGLYIAEVSSYHGEVIPLYYAMVTKADGTTGDAYEDDDSRAKAKGIVAGESQSRSIHDAGDEDWVLFRPIQSGAYQIQTNGDGDMKLDLYDAKGNLIATDDDSGTGLNARLGQTLQANTDYYIKAYAYKKDVTVDSYALNVTLLQTSELGDAYESDDDPAKAKAIKLGETQTHSIHIAGDVDWVTFTPSVSAEYTIQTVGSGLNCDTQLYLYESLADAQAGKYYKWNDDNGSDRNAMISTVLYAGKTYYVKAQAWEEYTIPSYGLKVTQNNGAGANSGINEDEYENDDLSGDCKPIAIGREYTHSIDVQSDTDWVRFFTHSSGTYTIQTTGQSDMSFIVYRRIPGGALVPYENGAEITGGGAGHNALYRVNLETDNWYYVRITTTGRASTTAGYGIRVDQETSGTKGDAYETMGGKSNDNAPSRANWLTLGYAQNHSIHKAGDEDWLSFKADATSQVVFSVDNSDAKQMRMYFYRKLSNGELEYLSETDLSTNGRAAKTLSVKSGELYYVKVKAVSSSVTVPSYNVIATYVKDTYEDDDTSAKATTIKIGETQTHNIHSQTDVDWIKFVPNTSGKYEFETFGDGDTYGILYKNSAGSNSVITQGGSGGSGGNVKLIANLTKGETYYLRLSGENNAMVSSYSVEVRNPITQFDEPNDTKANATALSANVSHTGSFHSSTDVDYYKVSSAAAGTYDFKTGDSSIDLAVYLGNSSMPVATGRGSVRVKIDSSSTVYVKAQEANGQLKSSYGITYSYEKPTVSNPEENYVIMFAGGAGVDGNQVRYYVNFANTYEALVEKYNIPRDHIYLLYADGDNAGGDFYLNGDFYNSSMTYAAGSHVYEATKANFKSVTESVAKLADANDHLFVYVYDHGSGEDIEDNPNAKSITGEERICTWTYWSDGGISGAEYNSWMSKISAGYQTHLFAQCFAGGILDALNMQSGDKKIYGAAADTHYSPSTSYVNPQTGIGSGGFAYEVMMALNNGVNNTSSIAKYVITDNIAQQRGNDDPYYRTNANSGFQIFAQA